MSSGRTGRVRVYLDGFDEVPSSQQRKRIAAAAQHAVDADARIQIVLTSREYVVDHSVRWLPKVNLCGFTSDQQEQLALQWIEGSEAEVESFFKQVNRLPALRALMSVPLLATLIILVFRQTKQVPQNRTRLYEMFVDLLSGGWDVAKGVVRDSHYGSAVKSWS
jgi:predicted NACHT family NTPase